MFNSVKQCTRCVVCRQEVVLLVTWFVILSTLSSSFQWFCQFVSLQFAAL